MARPSPAEELPLRYHTPDAWADIALRDPLALLSDHAHLEKKAAANALELLNRWPERRSGQFPELTPASPHLPNPDSTELAEVKSPIPNPTFPPPPPDWVQAMTSIARDEVEHLGSVTRLLARRGGRISRQHKNPYANALRGLVRLGQGTDELLDRLLVSALIEARSCERFEILAGSCPDADLARLYAGLCASERGHFRVFLELARHAADADEIEARWSWMLDAEAKIAADQTPGSRMHSGV